MKKIDTTLTSSTAALEAALGLEALEPRILLDAAVMATGAEALDLAIDMEVQQAVEPLFLGLAPTDEMTILSAPGGSLAGTDGEVGAKPAIVPIFEPMDPDSPAVRALTHPDLLLADLGVKPDIVPIAEPLDADDIATAELPSTGAAIVFVDASVQGFEALAESVPDGFEIVVIEAGEDGIARMADVLADRTDVVEIHILSHGDTNGFALGTATLNADTVAGEYAAMLEGLRGSLTGEADMLIYGCDFGQNTDLLDALAQATGADVAASTDDTGASAVGGDWVLEARVGTVEAATLNAAGFTGLLADTDGDGVDDSVDIDDDNDGILDINEGGEPFVFDLSTINIGGTFTEATGTSPLWLSSSPVYLTGSPGDPRIRLGAFPITDFETGSNNSGEVFAINAGGASVQNEELEVINFTADNLLPNSDYVLSFAHVIWGRSNTGTADRGQLFVDVNGTRIASLLGDPSKNFGVWTHDTFTVTSDANGEINVVFNVARGLGASGHDYLLDAINLTPTAGVFTPVDTDGDGAFDHQDIDSDNDGILDGLESEAAATPTGVDVFETGSVSLSVGGTVDTGTVTINRPAGATVRAVYVLSADNPDFNSGGTTFVPASDITVNGIAVTLDQTETSSNFTSQENINRWGNVTDELSGLINGLPDGANTLTLSEVVPDASNGSAIFVVWDDPNVQGGLVVIDFASRRTNSGSSFSIPTAPLSPDRSDFSLTMGLGISHSTGQAVEVTQVDVNGTTVTQRAGGSDDGANSVNVGSLWTVGDDGDPLRQPTDPNGINENERYDISSTITAGDTSIDITTSSSHAYDFLGVTWLAGTGIDVERVDLDSDGDGVSDRLDLDSDNDGIADAIEGHATAGYIDNLGENGTDADNDGYLAQFDQDDADWGSGQAFLADTDADGTPDYLDLDSDGDGVSDTIESGLTLTGVDADLNGIDDNPSIGVSYTNPDGVNPDPLNDLTNADSDASLPDFRSVQDTDGDGVGDFEDVDDDNDGILDTVEGLAEVGFVDLSNATVTVNGGGSAQSSGTKDTYVVTGISLGGVNATLTATETGNSTDRVQQGNLTIGLNRSNYGLADIFTPSDNPVDIFLSSAATLNGGGGEAVEYVITFDEPVTEFVFHMSNVDAVAYQFTGTNHTETFLSGGREATLDPATRIFSDTNSEGGVNTDSDIQRDGYGSVLIRSTEPGGITEIRFSIVDNPNATNANDGHSFTFSGRAFVDTDGDTVEDRLDLDSDNDGISDLEESGSGGLDANNDGVLDAMATPADQAANDLDNDGLLDSLDNGNEVTPRQSDSDSTADFRDLDSDNDYIPDAVEARATGAGNVITSQADTDGDGVLDHFDTSADFGGTFTTPVNTDAAIGNNADSFADYIDSNSDGDADSDRVESGLGALPSDVTYADADGSLVPGTGLSNEFGDTSEVAFREFNDPPFAVADSVTVIPGGPAVNVDLIANDRDPNGHDISIVKFVDSADPANPVTATIGVPFTTSSGLTVTLLADGTVDVTAPAGLQGNGRFGYFIADEFGLESDTISYITIATDTDGDGISNDVDIDDDNDGISDVEEGFASYFGVWHLFDQDFTAGNDSQLYMYLQRDTIGGTYTDLVPDGSDFGAPTNQTDAINNLAVDTDGQFYLIGADGKLYTTDDLTSDAFTSLGDAQLPTTADNLAVDDGVFYHVGEVAGVNTLFSSRNPVADGWTNEGAFGLPLSEVNGLAVHNGVFYALEVTGANNDDHILQSNTDPLATTGWTMEAEPDLGFNVENIAIGLGAIDVDTDGDGIADYLDLDSDNDGISDLEESGSGGVDADLDGMLDGMASPALQALNDLDGDGLIDSLDNGNEVTPRQTDSDMIADFRDLDSDGDRIADAIEARATTAGNVITATTDTDGDGVLDHFDTDADFGGTFTAPVNTDAAIANNADTDADYIDTDSDGDGLLDANETGLSSATDANSDGIVDDAAIGVSYSDADGTLVPSTDLNNFVGDTSEVAYRELNAPVLVDLDDDGTTPDRDHEVSVVLGDSVVVNPIPNGSITDPDSSSITQIIIEFDEATLVDGADEVFVIGGEDISLDPASVQFFGTVQTAITVNGNGYTVRATYLNPSFNAAQVSLSIVQTGAQGDGQIPLADANAILQTLQYRNDAGSDATLGDRTYTLRVIGDQPATSTDSNTADGVITIADPAPIIDLNDDNTSADLDTALAYTEGDGTVTVIPATGDAIDLANNITALSVTLAGFADGADETLSVNGVSVTPGMDSSDTSTTLGGVAVTLELIGNTLTVSATDGVSTLDEAALDGLLRGLTYAHGSDAPTGGTRTLSFSATDASGNVTATDAVATITVTAVNDAPVTALPIADQSGSDSAAIAPLDVTPAFSDPDGDVLSYSATGLPAGLSIDMATGLITGTPAADASQGGPAGDGVYSVTVTATDPDGLSVDTTFTYTLGNPAPVVDTPIGAQAAEDGAPVSYASDISDVDNDTLAYSASGLPMGLTIDSATGVISGTLDNSASQTGGGIYMITVTADDAQGGTVTDSFTLTVTNPAPLALDNSVTTQEDTAVTVDVLGNDTDADGDTLTVSGVSQGANGSVVIDPVTGNPVYTPNADFNGTDSFTYTVDDGEGGTATATVNVTVDPVNDAPVAVDDVISTDEDTPVTITVRGNDTDVEGDTLTVVSATQPANGTVAIDLVTGNPVYTPNVDFNGTDSFTYTVDDGEGGTATATVNVTVDPVNDAPVAADDVISTGEDTPVTIAVRGNDTDVEGDTLTVVSVIQPASGTVAIDPVTGNPVYTPGANFNGTDSFTYTVDDGQGGAAMATVNVTVDPVNDAPIAADDVISTDEDTPVTISVRGNDTDVEGDTLTVVSVTQPANGSVVIDPVNGDPIYTPDTDFNGTDSFTYTVDDGQGGTATATVNITVDPVNDTPVVVATAPNASEQDAVPVTPVDAAALFTDVDGDTLVYTAVGLPAGVNIDPTSGLISGTPALDASQGGPGSDGIYVVTITASDPDGASVSTTLSLDVSNPAPTASDDAAVLSEDGQALIDVRSNDVDPDGDTLSVSAVTQGTHGSVAIDPASGNPVYTPNANFNGTDSFTYTVDDGEGGTDTATVTLTITPVNDAPVAADDMFTTDEDIPVRFDVRDNDADLDGDALYVVAVTQGTNGSVAIDPATGEVVYTPNADFNGTDSFTYTVEDGQGGSDTATVAVTVTPVNDAPEASDDAAATSEDGSVEIDVRANDGDVDGNALTVASVTQPANGSVTIDPLTGNPVYTPNGDFNGTDSFTYTVEDGQGGADTATVVVTVMPVNDAPVASDDTRSTAEDTSVTIDVRGNDADVDGDALTVASVTQPANGSVTIDPITGNPVYTPNADFNGTDSFTYTVEDGQGGTDTATVIITVLPVNDAPIATDDADTTSEDNPVTIKVLGNDSDVDGDTLTVASVTQPANGSVVIDPFSGELTYTPSADFNGSDSFTYTVEDGEGGTDTATVVVVVAPVNDSPVATDERATTAEDASVEIEVRGNDADVDGDPLTVVSVAQPANGSVVIDPVTGNPVYTPNADFNGTDSFTYTVEDGQGGSATATVVIAVTPVNDAPVASDDAISTAEDAPVTINVRGNDADVDGDPLTVVSVTQPANGSVSLDPVTGDPIYTPNADFNGTDSFTYTVEDGQGGTDTAAVVVMVAPVNDAPVAVDDVQTTAEDMAITIDVRANDTDVDGDPLGVSLVTQPANGSVVIDSVTGNPVYTPNADFNGSDSFTYTVEDGQGGTATATAVIMVEPVNDAPVAVDDAASTSEDASVEVNVLGNDGDIDGDTLTVASVTQPANGTVTIDPASGNPVYTPDADFNGTDSFTYVVEDGQGGTDTATAVVTVTPVNDAPVAIDDTASTSEDASVEVNVLGNDGDIDGDTLTVVSVTQPANGSVAIDPVSGNPIYTPDADFNGSDSFTYTVEDGQGGTATATAVIMVAPVNDAPEASDDQASTSEDIAITIDVLGNDTDIDADPLTVTTVTQPANGTVTIDTVSGLPVYTPDADFNGTDSFTYTVEDGQGGSGTALVSVTVEAVNDAPIALDDTASTSEDTPLTIAVRGNDSDVDGDALSVTSVGLAGNGMVAIDPVSGNPVYTPNAEFNGTDSFTYTVEDGEGGTATATVVVTIDAVNDAPVALADDATTLEDTPVEIDVRGNDTDVEGDALSVVSVTQPSGGTVVIDAVTGNPVYTPNADFNGTDSFTYTARDGEGGQSTATVNVVVRAQNDAPVAQDDALSTAEDTPVRIPVLSNDSDVDGDTLIVTIDQPANHGTVSLGADGNPVYTPDADFNGTDSFTYVVSDGLGGTASATVTITIEPGNDAPVLTGAPTVASLTDAQPVDPIDAAALFDDIDGDVLRYTSADLPSWLSLDTDTGLITGTPPGDASVDGRYAVTVTATDANGESVSTVLTLEIANIAPVIDAPTPDESFADGDVVRIAPQVTDADGDSLRFTATGLPDGLSIIAASGEIVGTLPNDASQGGANGDGEYTVSLTADDGQGGTVSETLVIRVGNPGPDAVDDTLVANEGEVITASIVLGSDTDPDRDILRVIPIDAGAGTNGGTFSLAGDGTLSFDAGSDFDGLAEGETAVTSIAYTLIDADGATDMATVFVTVTGTNDAPVANGPLTAQEGTDAQALTPYDVSGQFADVDAETLTFSVEGAPAWLSIDPVTGVITGTPPSDASVGGPNADGVYAIFVIATDSDGESVTGQLLYTVANTDLVAANDSYTIDEDGSVTGNLVAANDLDADGDVLTVDAVALPDGSALAVGDATVLPEGTLSVNADGTFEFTAAPDYNGVFVFGYTATDSQGSTDVATVTITVNAQPDGPRIVLPNGPDTPGTPNGPEGPITPGGPDTPDNGADPDSPLPRVVGVDGKAMSPLDVSVVFSDPDGQPLRFTLSDAPDWLSIDPVTGVVSGTPTSNASQGGPVGDGRYAVSVVATDPDGMSVSTVLNLALSNTAPEAVADGPFDTPEDTAVTLDVLVNDTDVDGDVLSVSAIDGQPISVGTPVSVDGGVVTLTEDGNLVFTPDANTAGLVSFGYTLSDADGATSDSSVSVNVVPTNDSPVLGLGPNVSTAVDDAPISVLGEGVSITDVDGGQTTSVSLSLDGFGDGDDEVLSLGGVDLTVPGTTIITVDGVDYSVTSDGSNVSLTTVGGPLPNAAIEGLLATLSYANGSDMATLGDRTVTISVTDADGGVSEAQDVLITLSADTTAPDAPIIGTTAENPNGTLSVSGTGEPGALVEVTFPDGSVVTLVIDETGEWTATSLTQQPDGDISVVLTDPSGNVSDPAVSGYVSTFIDRPVFTDGTPNVGRSALPDASAADRGSDLGSNSALSSAFTDGRAGRGGDAGRDAFGREGRAHDFDRTADERARALRDALFRGDDLMIDVPGAPIGEQIWIEAVAKGSAINVEFASSTTGERTVQRWEVTQANGAPLPLGVEVMGDYIVIERTLDAERITLRVRALLENGQAITQSVEIDLRTGTVEPMGEASAGGQTLHEQMASLVLSLDAQDRPLLDAAE